MFEIILGIERQPRMGVQEGLLFGALGILAD